MTDIKIVSTRRITEQLIQKHEAQQGQIPWWQRIVALLSKAGTITRQERVSE